MKTLHIASLLVVTVCISSLVTYKVTSAPKLHLFKPEKVDIAFSQEEARYYCGNYLLNEVQKDKSKKVRILNSDGFGFSYKEIYCQVSAEVATFSTNKAIKTETKEYYFSLEADTELTFNEITKTNLDDAFGRYKDQFIVN